MKGKIKIETDDLGIEERISEGTLYFRLDSIDAAYRYSDEGEYFICIALKGLEYCINYDLALWKEIKIKLNDLK